MIGLCSDGFAQLQRATQVNLERSPSLSPLQQSARRAGWEFNPSDIRVGRRHLCQLLYHRRMGLEPIQLTFAGHRSRLLLGVMFGPSGSELSTIPASSYYNSLDSSEFRPSGVVQTILLRLDLGFQADCDTHHGGAARHIGDLFLPILYNTGKVFSAS